MFSTMSMLWLEPARCLADFGAGQFLHARVLAAAPRGDGHPVVVFPGFNAGDSSTAPLREFLCELGYAAVPWPLGCNVGGAAELDHQLEALAGFLEALHAQADARASLVGWSLGGLYARELAKRCPRLVRRVITLGTPFKDAASDASIGWLYEWLSGLRGDELRRRLALPPPVPFTSIYSTSDPVVPWQTAQETVSPRAENVAVDASHCGLGYHPEVLAIVADRLARPVGRASRSRQQRCGRGG